MRVPDEVLECVCFLCVKDQNKNTYQYGGTGFFISVPSEKHSGKVYVYIVTAKHCIEKAKQYGNLYLRLNKLDGNAEMVELKGEWLYSENEASDVAIIPIPSLLHRFQYGSIGRGMFVTNEVIKKEGIGIGDDLVITGLFTRRFGSQRNIPIVRTGIISAMPSEPLEDVDTGLEYHAYLAEVRSIGGLSGSPAFVFLGPARTYQKKIKIGQTVYLIGLVRGHWDVQHRGQPLDFTMDELQAVNMGIAIITPIQDALDIINSKELTQIRRQSDVEISKLRAPTEDMDSAKYA